MSDYAIRVNNLSKVYYIGRKIDRDATLIARVFQALLGPARRTMKLLRGQKTGAAELDEEFWALQDVSFDVRQGEVIGIIGRNGAGKSTLLKILSRITYPTTGRIELTGRVGSLLEVGTGFNDELTGRENVFLNGTILGMTRQEVFEKFDEIVEFSGIEKFIDTPVKHYSSGMKVRLAFAVAAHLEPEILLVDEVLSVGDAEFQAKSIGKMNDVASAGRTVVFVSHNMGAVNNLCQKVIWLDNGQIVEIGDTETIIPKYLTHNTQQGARVTLDAGDPEIAVIHEMGVQNHEFTFSDQLSITEDFYLWMRFSVHSTINSAQVALAVASQSHGVIVFATTHTDTLDTVTPLKPGQYDARVRVPGHLLNRGGYVVNGRIIGIAGGESRKSHAMAMEAVSFSVVDTGSVASKFNDKRRTVIIPILDWELNHV